MSQSPLSRRFPVTITRLPVTRCQVCRHTVAYRPGAISEALTGTTAAPIPKRSTSRPGDHRTQAHTITADDCRRGQDHARKAGRSSSH